MLANQRKVSSSTHNQALSALLFLHREVLVIDLPWLLLGHSDVSTTMIYIHVLRVAAGGTAWPLDALVHSAC